MYAYLAAADVIPCEALLHLPRHKNSCSYAGPKNTHNTLWLNCSLSSVFILFAKHSSTEVRWLRFLKEYRAASRGRYPVVQCKAASHEKQLGKNQMLMQVSFNGRWQAYKGQ